MHNLDLTLSDISKIEGKASCEIKIRNGKIDKLKFSIAEYKRFYTQAINGKDIMALPQLTARICGTCSNAHLLCALKAVEDAVKLIPSPQTVLLRKLLNYGLIIRDHALHLYVFVLPDLFNKDSILDFDENNSLEHKFLDDTFTVKRSGNMLGKIVGGRSVHAPFLTVGGFLKIPTVDDIQSCLPVLNETREKVIDLIKLFAERDIKLTVKDLIFTGLADEEYSFLYGDLIRGNNEKISAKKYGDYLEYTDIPYSHASGYKFDGKVYMVGALARLNLAKEKLHPKTKSSLAKYLDFFPSANIFYNNLAQAIEIIHAIDSSISLIEKLELTPEKPIVPIRREGIGVGVIEAPRGMLYYKLQVDSAGKIITGQIVVPTGQNQICIETAIREYLLFNLDRLSNKDLLENNIERIVRAFDPCMSCASHFLKVKWI